MRKLAVPLLFFLHSIGLVCIYGKPLRKNSLPKEERKQRHGRRVSETAKPFDFVLPFRAVTVGAIARVARTAESLKARIDVGGSPFPNTSSLFQFPHFTG